jgi:hypothetical protein
MIGRAAFFAPLISTVPFRRFPPLMISLSRFSSSKKFVYSNGIQGQKGRVKKVLDASEHKRSSCYLLARILWYIFCMREFTLYEDDNGIWTAECKELPGYHATGKTKEEALQKMQSALLIYHPCRCED